MGVNSNARMVVACTQTLFYFSFRALENIGVRDSKGTPTPLRWRSINPPRFIFYHARSTDFEDKIEGL